MQIFNFQIREVCAFGFLTIGTYLIFVICNLRFFAKNG